MRRSGMRILLEGAAHVGQRFRIAAERSLAKPAIVKTFSLIRRKRDAYFRRFKGWSVMPQCEVAAGQLEIGPEFVRLQIDGRVQLADRFGVRTVVHQPASDAGVFPGACGGGKWEVERCGRR